MGVAVKYSFIFLFVFSILILGIFTINAAVNKQGSVKWESASNINGVFSGTTGASETLASAIGRTSLGIVNPSPTIFNILPTSPNIVREWETYTGSSGPQISNHYILVDEDSDEDSSSLSTRDYVFTSTTNYNENFETTSPTDIKGTTMTVQLFIYASTGNRRAIEYKICDSENLASQHCTPVTTLNKNSNSAWYSSSTETITCSAWGANCQNVANNLKIMLKSVSQTGLRTSGSVQVYATYIKLSYSNQDPYYVGSGPLINDKNSFKTISDPATLISGHKPSEIWIATKENGNRVEMKLSEAFSSARNLCGDSSVGTTYSPPSNLKKYMLASEVEISSGESLQ
ncbi:MAG: hypothetical protein AABY03_02555, partial [Nanoarchaeota archaeon]